MPLEITEEFAERLAKLEAELAKGRMPKCPPEVNQISGDGSLDRPTSSEVSLARKSFQNE